MDRKVSVRRRRYRKPWTEKCKGYFRNFLAFMFSNVGIIGLVVGYTVAGAFIFREIEKDTDKELKINVTIARNATAFNILYITLMNNTFNEMLWKKRVGDEFLGYAEIVTRAVRNGYDGSNDPEDNKSWSFPNGFLYSLTVITTIGYGNVVPRTRVGKIVTIIYAIIGMPLFLLYLSNIGDIMARCFKWLYAKLCLCRCCPGVAKKRDERQRRRVEELGVEYYGNHDGSESPEVSIRRASTQSRQNKVTYTSREIHEEEDDDDNSEYPADTITEVSYDFQSVTVPITVCLTIMMGYILGGTLLFKHYEQGWSTLDGFYFCFISLSTIGFGDLVPGKKGTYSNDLVPGKKGTYSGDDFQPSAIFGSMYLMLGMALIAMCFNLMQEEVIHKIRRTIRSVKYIFRCNR